MTIIQFTVLIAVPVWECAAKGDDRPLLAGVHFEFADASHIRATCSDGYALASVTYEAQEPLAEFEPVDVPAEAFRRIRPVPSKFDEDGEPEFVSRSVDVTLDLDAGRAFICDGDDATGVYADFIRHKTSKYPDWRDLLRKCSGAWQGAPVNTLGFDPTLVAQATKAIGYDRLARVRLPSKPDASLLLYGDKPDHFAIVMPMFIDHENGTKRIASVIALGEPAAAPASA